MAIIETLKSKVAMEPNIILSDNSVIVGSVDHGLQIPPKSIRNLINSLDGVIALLIEGRDDMFQIFHPMSIENLVKASTDGFPLSYLPESSDKNDLGDLLLETGVPEKLAEVYVPAMYIRNNGGITEELFRKIPHVLHQYKQIRFGFIDIERGSKNYLRLLEYWVENDLDISDLDDFSYDFEKFMGDVREYAFWKPAIEKFRHKYNGKIAICCGNYHVKFVQEVLTGVEIQKPNWESHIDNRRKDLHKLQNKDMLERIYKTIDNLL
jgi:hypothetical protein